MDNERKKHICINCKNLKASKLISDGDGISLVMVCIKGHQDKSDSCEDYELKSIDWGLK